MRSSRPRTTATDGRSHARAYYESMSKSRILVAMSGGVDSAVAAPLLHREGHDDVDVTLRL